MHDVEITFQREGLSGVVAVGNYLSDAMRRMGLRPLPHCDVEGRSHECVVVISTGKDLLSPLTTAETEHFASAGRKAGERLACQARIIKPGEIEVMTKEKKEAPPRTESSGEQYRKDFTELPLEQKISELVRLEAITLGETFSYILNSPFKVFEKIGDVMADFGIKLENEAKKATRPEEHTSTGESGTNGQKGTPKKGGQKKKAG